MKIDRNASFLTPVPDTAPAGAAKDKVDASRSAAGPSGVASSSTAALLPSTNGDFDAARVALIRENISAGRYQVNTAKIADGLLASVRELLGKRAP